MLGVHAPSYGLISPMVSVISPFPSPRRDVPTPEVEEVSLSFLYVADFIFLLIVAPRSLSPYLPTVHPIVCTVCSMTYFCDRGLLTSKENWDTNSLQTIVITVTQVRAPAKRQRTPKPVLQLGCFHA